MINYDPIKDIHDIDSSLNEIDIEMTKIMHELMLHADPRVITRNSNKPLWTQDRVFLVDELETEEIFNAYLISNDKKEIDITYPLCALTPKDITEVFWGTGNRLAQWEFYVNNVDEFNIGSEVLIIKGEYKGLKGIIKEIVDNHSTLILNVNNVELEEDINNCKLLNSQDFSFKAKQFRTNYDIAILVDNKKEARYLQDKFILRCSDAHVWHPFKSKLLNGTESYIFTVFGIPNINRYPKSGDKLKGGPGYIYGISFSVDVWAILADEPLPVGLIEQIRMNIHTDTEIRVNKILINE